MKNVERESKNINDTYSRINLYKSVLDKKKNNNNTRYKKLHDINLIISIKEIYWDLLLYDLLNEILLNEIYLQTITIKYFT